MVAPSWTFFDQKDSAIVSIKLHGWGREGAWPWHPCAARGSGWYLDKCCWGTNPLKDVVFGPQCGSIMVGKIRFQKFSAKHKISKTHILGHPSKTGRRIPPTKRGLLFFYHWFTFFWTQKGWLSFPLTLHRWLKEPPKVWVFKNHWNRIGLNTPKV